MQLDKDVKEYLNKNQKCINDIGSEKNAITELQQVILDMKREIATTLVKLITCNTYPSFSARQR